MNNINFNLNYSGLDKNNQLINFDI